MAALVLAGLMSVLVAGVMAGSGFDTAGSVVFGAGGLVFAGIAAITAQLSEYPRAAAGTAGTVLGAAFVLRGLGDMAAVQGSGPAWLSWHTGTVHIAERARSAY